MKTPILFKKSQMLTHKSTDIGVYTVKNDSPPPPQKKTTTEYRQMCLSNTEMPSRMVTCVGFSVNIKL